MQAFVTGGTGFVGAHVIRVLVEHGVKVRALVRPTSNCEALTGVPVEFVEGDLRAVKSFQHTLRDVDCLFHVAADYRLWVPDPGNMHATNVQGTRRLLKAAKEAGVERIVYTSSAVTVRVPPERLGTENDYESPGTCRSVYQRTKVLAEQAVWQLIGEGVPVTIVNPSTPLGPGDWRPTPTGRLIVDYLNRRLPAFLDARLNWVDVRDVAQGHWLAATRGAVGQRYILGHQNLSLTQFFKILHGVSGVPSPRMRIPYVVAYLAGLVGNTWGRISGHEPQATLDGVRSAGAPMQYDSSKAVKELGLSQTPIPLAAHEAVHWFREHAYAPTQRSTP